MSTLEKPGTVGYGKPPVETRFKPGQSGNPGGRPKGTQNVLTIFARLLRERLVVTQNNGRRRSITTLEATLTAMMNRAIQGDAKATQLVLQFAQLVEAALASGPAGDLKEADKAVLANLLKRLGHDVADQDERSTKKE